MAPSCSSGDLQVGAKHDNQVKRCQAKLGLDVAVVAAGARPACMLDYAPCCKHESLVHICSHYNETMGGFACDHGRLMVLRWDDVAFVANINALRRRVQRLLRPAGGGLQDAQMVFLQEDGTFVLGDVIECAVRAAACCLTCHEQKQNVLTQTILLCCVSCAPLLHIEHA